MPSNFSIGRLGKKSLHGKLLPPDIEQGIVLNSHIWEIYPPAIARS
jgi:hypothetical protein